MATPSPTTGPVATLLAATDSLSDILAGLHARVQAATSATCSVLLEIDPDTDHLHPTSGRGLEQLASDPWCTDEVSREAARDVLATGRSRQIAPLDEACPTLAHRLRTPAAFLAPVLFAGRPLGLLVLGLREAAPPLEWADEVAACAAGFAVAIAQARLRHEVALQADIGALVSALGHDGPTAIPPDRLQAFCAGISRLLGADRVELWRHDRDARRLELAVSSLPPARGEPASVDASDPQHVAAAALRQQKPEVSSRRMPGPYSMLRHAATVPLRGRRRALGVLLLDGLRLGPGDGARLVPHLDTLGQRLAALLESSQLLDDVIRARRDLENTFDSMRDPLVVCSPHGHIVRVNEAFARFAGRTRATLRAIRLSAIVDPVLGEWLDRVMDAMADGTDIQSQATEVTDGASGATLHVIVAPLAERPNLAAGFVVALRDVTEERRLESERAALRERLAQSETLSHLVAGIAHEINNPLQAVTGHVELVRRAGGLTPAADSQLALVHREADRAARIVRNLLLLAGSGRIVARPVSVNAAVRRALANRRAAWRAAGLRASLALDPHLPRISGDALLLQQAILNVLLNAEQALGEQRSGLVEVATSYDRTRQRVEVRIRDNGPGIPDAVLPHVFDPFYTTKEAGRGLGLSLALRIVHEHGGDVAAATRSEGGAEFTLYFPLPRVLK